MVARRDMGHILADCLNDPGAFMSQHRGQRRGEMLVAHHDVRMADAAGDDAHQDFVRSRRAKRHRFDDKRLASLTRDCRADGARRCRRTHDLLLGRGV
jgi:hypothetical protein